MVIFSMICLPLFIIDISIFRLQDDYHFESAAFYERPLILLHRRRLSLRYRYSSLLKKIELSSAIIRYVPAAANLYQVRAVFALASENHRLVANHLGGHYRQLHRR